MNTNDLLWVLVGVGLVILAIFAGLGAAAVFQP